ncbi:MAG: acyltransferase [Acidimicrobiia bacterium]
MAGSLHRLAAAAVHGLWGAAARYGAIDSGTRRAGRFAAFGSGTRICFPATSLMGEQWIELGRDTLIAENVTLSAGMSPSHVPENQPLLRVGDRCVFGRGTGIVADWGIEIGNDVWTGHYVYVTDHNHGYEDLGTPPGLQIGRHERVRILDGAWLGHGTVVLPGVTVGRHAVVGAGSIVTSDLPDFCVAAGNPARVLRQHVTGEGWVRPFAAPGREPGHPRRPSVSRSNPLV